jgi:hypothetical protein
MKIRLLICITFYYKFDRLIYLQKSLESLSNIDVDKQIFIITNTFDSDELLSIQAHINSNTTTIKSYENGHDFLLTWSHFSLMKKNLNEFTHFLYLEDDIEFSIKNLNYWIDAREKLKYARLIPGFFRIEKLNDFNIISTDVIKPMSLYDCGLIDIGNSETFISIVYPYQGMYLFDRELMNEFLESKDFNPDFNQNSSIKFWNGINFGIREKSALGLTYISIPVGFKSRIVLPFDFKNGGLNETCFIHHLPNNYATDINSPFGKVNINNLFLPKSTKLYLLSLFKQYFKTILFYIIRN